MKILNINIKKLDGGAHCAPPILNRVNGPKCGPAAGLRHEVTDTLVDTPDKRKIIGS